MQSISIIILVVIIAIQQIQIWSMSNHIKVLFNAQEMLCKANDKQLVAVKEMLKLVKEESFAASRLFETVMQSVSSEEDK